MVTSGGRCGGLCEDDTKATLTNGSPSGRRKPWATAATCSHSATLGHRMRALSAAADLRERRRVSDDQLYVVPWPFFVHMINGCHEPRLSPNVAADKLKHRNVMKLMAPP